jgi:hypothetical protein
VDRKTYFKSLLPAQVEQDRSVLTKHRRDFYIRVDVILNFSNLEQLERLQGREGGL